MTDNDSGFPLSLQKKGKEVKIYHSYDKGREYEYFTIMYYVGNNRRRATRRKLDEAKKFAREKLDQMAAGNIPVTLSHKDWELLKDLKKVAKGRSPWRFLEDAKAASKMLDGATSMADAAEFWLARHFHKSDALVSKVYEDYMRHVEQNSSERNFRDARNRVGKFEDAFGSVAINDVSSDSILAFIQAMDVVNRTKNNYRAQIITFFRWARKRGFLEEGRGTAPEAVDPWKVIEKEVTIFTIAQTRKLFRGMREDIEAYAAIGAFAGLRPSEIQRLTWGLINFEDKYIHVTAEVAKKVNRSRYVPMSKNLIEWLLPHRKGDAEKVCYFKAPEMLSADAIERKVVDAWPPDVLRHSFCSYRLAATKDIGKVSEEAENSPSIIRKHYRRPVPEKSGKEYFAIRRDNLKGKIVKLPGAA